MFDILMYLFESYFYANQYPDSDKLSVKLSVAGFEDEEIHRALAWFTGLKHLTEADYPAAINKSGPRCYAEMEIRRVGHEGLRFLTFWEECGMITPVEREMILDRAVALGRDGLALEHVKLIALLVLWNRREELDSAIVEDLMAPTDTALLH